MGFVFTKRGVVLEACSSWFLPKVVGMSQALEWVMSGRVFDAEGVGGRSVKKVLPPDELLPAARALAKEPRRIRRRSPWRFAVRCCGDGRADHPMEAHKIDRAASGLWANCRIAKRCVSFLEKRPPNFPMKVSKDMPDYYPWWDEEFNWE